MEARCLASHSGFDEDLSLLEPTQLNHLARLAFRTARVVVCGRNVNYPMKERVFCVIHTGGYGQLEGYTMASNYPSPSKKLRLNHLALRNTAVVTT